VSKLAEFRQLEKHLAEQLQALEALKGDAGLKQEIEFETKLRDLLAKYGYSLKDVVNLLDPDARRRAPVSEPKTGIRKARKVKVIRTRTQVKPSKRKVVTTEA
jgi:hypothetical protein